MFLPFPGDRTSDEGYRTSGVVTKVVFQRFVLAMKFIVEQKRSARFLRKAFWKRNWQLTEVRSISEDLILRTVTFSWATMVAVRASLMMKPSSPKVVPG